MLESLTPDETEEQPQTSSSPGPCTVTAGDLSVSAVFDISTLTYETLFDALSSFEKSLGLSEANACSVLTELLRNSAKNETERVTVETVSAGLEKIAALEFEVDKQERMRKLVSEKMKLKRLFETPDQRAQRLERMRARYRSTRTSDGGTIINKRERNGEETESAKEERLRKLREYQRRRLERELPEQREKRLAKMRLNQKLRRERQNQQKQLNGGLVSLTTF